MSMIHCILLLLPTALQALKAPCSRHCYTADPTGRIFVAMSYCCSERISPSDRRLSERTQNRSSRGFGYTPCMLPRNLRPLRLSRRIEPFDSDQFIFELKTDGFRALVDIEARARATDLQEWKCVP